MDPFDADAAVQSVLRDLVRCLEAAQRLSALHGHDRALQLVQGELADIAQHASAVGPGGHPVVRSTALDVAMQLRACFDTIQQWASGFLEPVTDAAPLAHALLLAAASTGRLARRLTSADERMLVADLLIDLQDDAVAAADHVLLAAATRTLRLFERALDIRR